MVPNELQNAVASAGGNIFGYLAWYDCEGAHITRSRLSQLFDKYGMPKNADGEFPDLPDDIKPKNAFQKACRKALTEEGSSSDTRKLVVKLIIDGDSKLVYGVVDLPIDKIQEGIEPDFSDRVWFDKQNQTVHNDNKHPVSLKIGQIYNQYCGEYTTRDIARMVVGTLDRMKVVHMRRAGVLYFIPSRYTKDLEALQNVVNDIGSCNFQTLALYSGDGTNQKSVTENAKSQISDKIKNMKDDLAELKQSIDDGTIKGQTASNSIDVRYERYKELKEKCLVLADSLKIKAEILLGDLDEVGRSIKEDMLSAAA